MAECYHPLKGFPTHIVNGKQQYKVCSYDVDHVEKQGNTWIPVLDKKMSPFSESIVRNWILIPCGHCDGCLSNRSQRWADRCMLELQYHDEAYFLTLTYDDNHIRVNSWLDPETGECGESYTLCKRDVQLFLKSLRKSQEKLYDRKIRFFCCGEYGSKTHRPHYHLIVFGLHLEDLQFFKLSSNGQDKIYQSNYLSNIWKRGFVSVGYVSYETCAYTARYVLKKQFREKAEVYKRKNYEPEFLTMSRRPGIGRQYWDEKGDEIYDFQGIYLSTDKGSKFIRPPRYFDKQLEKTDPLRYAAIKEQRRESAENAVTLKLGQTSQDYLSMLESAHYNLSDRLKKLKRSGI